MTSGFKTLYVFTSLIVVSLGLSACGPADQVRVENRAGKQPVIEKGTKPVSLIEGEKDFYLHAFDELGWSLRSADMGINQISRPGSEGCMTYRKGNRDGLIAIVDFNCTFEEVLGPDQTSYRRVLTGRETYNERSAESPLVTMTAVFDQRIYSVNDRKLVGQGSLRRGMKLTRPARGFSFNTKDTTAAYPLMTNSLYVGQVAVDSNRLGESIKSTIDGVFTSARSAGEILKKDSKIVFERTPERAADEKANLNVKLEITASNDVTFSNPSGDCLRPIGQFAFVLTQGTSTVSGTLTTSANGIVLSTGGSETIPWGTRCLER